MTAAVGSAVRPHLPDEPPARGDWHAEVLGGAALEQVLVGPGGLAGWLWSRWQALGGAGWTPEGFAEVVVGYRREIWLWMAGERTWAHCCSGLLGRLERRRPG
ncbi:MAG: hypothetical protein ACYCU7_15400 [Acidimicrobiales bacterium]